MITENNRTGPVDYNSCFIINRMRVTVHYHTTIRPEIVIANNCMMGNSELCITSATKIVPYLKHCFGSYRYITTSAKSMNAFAMNNKLTLETYECCISAVSRAIKTYGNTSPSPPPRKTHRTPSYKLLYAHLKPI